MYTAVVFDFGNVLARINRLAFSQALTPYCPHDADMLGKLLWGNELEVLLETGRMDTRTYYAEAIRRIDAGPELDFETFCRLFMLIIEPNPDGIAALRFVHSRGLRSFILSNISFLHSTWLCSNEDMATIPEFHIFSFKVGAMKPDPKIWQTLLRRSGLQASECLYVDDIPAYCDQARALGFGTLHYDFSRHNLSRELEQVL